MKNEKYKFSLEMNVISNRAITLISLIITIIILIILSGVVINISIGENGLFNKTKRAKENYIIATNEEIEKITNINMESILNEENKTNLMLASQITANNYGEKINYNVNGIDDWKIFYKDENDEIFIIASKYLPANKLPNECGFGTYSSNNPYRAYWSVAPEFTEKWENNKKLFKAERYSLNAEQDNLKCISTLLDTENWNSFVNSNYADLAIGSPTLEMWCKSWNEKGYINLDIEDIENQDVIDLSNTQAYKETDNLYFPYKKSESNCYGYWFSAPYISEYDNNGLMGINYKGELSGNGYFQYWGIRPVIHLKSKIEAKWNVKEKLWELQ